ncbi:hypothetical protein OHAE_4745 [Ochrobactrum soli]|uniref:Uncharacterized protein n=1 Tax=Ochrobactrum soli TaxID=2448455 RepID=A0A2P9HCY8_9HYPH|nr:hypothetical protein OHAE_4745 [[Ochrobactrum] soli]
MEGAEPAFLTTTDGAGWVIVLCWAAAGGMNDSKSNPERATFAE